MHKMSKKRKLEVLNILFDGDIAKVKKALTNKKILLKDIEPSIDTMIESLNKVANALGFPIVITKEKHSIFADEQFSTASEDYNKEQAVCFEVPDDIVKGMKNRLISGGVEELTATEIVEEAKKLCSSIKITDIDLFEPYIMDAASRNKNLTVRHTTNGRKFHSQNAISASLGDRNIER